MKRNNEYRAMFLASVLLGLPCGLSAQESPEIPAPAASRDAEPAVGAVSGSSTGRRQTEQLELGTTSITGNQELPKVLYIMPWKRGDAGGALTPPNSALMNEVLEPVDRVEFRRELGYYQTLNPPPK